jgi:cytochrome c-type biogenesis protein CcmH/NrfG
MPKFCRLYLSHFLLSIAIAILGDCLTSIAAPDINLPKNRATRWLEIRQFRSRVMYQPVKNSSRAAKVGDRLQKIGDRLTTAKLSEATLTFDDGIGNVKVTEDTVLQIKRMQTTLTGGRITLLSVPKGLARLQIRRFKNSSSKLQIQTPAGVAGVRGTEFGVGVDPQGKTFIATLSGLVTASAQGKTVNVNPGFFSTIVPGQPPTDPQPIDRTTCLNVKTLTEVNTGSAKLVAQVKPSNLVFVDGQAVPTDKEGKFEIQAPYSSDRRLLISVRSMGGEEQNYRLKVGFDPWRFYREGDILQAERLFRQQLQEDEKNADALLGLGYIAYRRNDLPLAQQRFDQALAANPNQADARIGSARIALRQSEPKPEDLKKLEELLVQQIKQQPDNLDYWSLLGYISQKEGNLTLASQRFEEILKRSPNNLDGLIGLGLVRLNQQNKAEALALLEQAAKQTNDPGRLAEIQTYLDRAK